MDGRSPQDHYASNLLREQSFGYPLRNPRPNEEDRQGLQIGDVGYVNEYGEFKYIFNIHDLPQELKELGRRNFSLDQPAAKEEFGAEKVFKAGVKQVLEKPSADFAFTMTSNEGAILILPDGASRAELDDKKKLEEILDHIKTYAVEWCRFAQKETLYLVTAVFKSKSWTLGSFWNGGRGEAILVHVRSSDGHGDDKTGTCVYHWSCEGNIDNPVPPRNNTYLNQTVLLKGFKMTVRWDWLAMVQRAERIEWWLTTFLASLWMTVSRRLLSRIMVGNLSPNFDQPHHPLDTINRVLLEEHPGVNVAVTHDNDWIKMIDRGLPPEHLMQEDRLREFVLKEQIWDLDPEYNVVYLRDNVEGSNSELPRDPSSHSRSGDPRLAIINIRLESVDIGHIYSGVCILVQFGSTTKRTENKPHAGIVEWDDELVLPSDESVGVTVCGVFQLGSTLGIRGIFAEQIIDIKRLSGDTCAIRLSFGKADSSSSLLITLGRHFSHFETLSDYDDKSDFVKTTNSGFEALYSYYDDPKEEYLGCALGFFDRALHLCEQDATHRAVALFNLATSKLIRCQALGTYAELNIPVELYEDALKSYDSDNQDRPTTLLLLAQTLLSRYGQERDESIPMRIGRLLDEIGPDNSRNHRTKEVIMRTCTFYRAVNSGNPLEVDGFINDLRRGAYISPYGYSDKPRILHKLGVALWERFQHDANPDYLNQSIMLSEEALRLTPDGHHDRRGIVECLGRSFVKRIEVYGGLTDIDMSTDLIDLGERVVMALDKLSSDEDAAISLKELRDQIALMSASNTAIQYIEQEVPAPRLKVIQNLIDEWSTAGSIPVACKRQLGILLSFLAGDGESLMCKLLQNVDWPFKEYMTKETMRILEGHLHYFNVSFASRLGI